MATALQKLLADVRSCSECASELPFDPNPIVQVGRGASVAIIGQAPGTKVHESGIPWQDASGDHLREWLDIESTAFYDPKKMALIPMGFCYPGARKGGDAPPRPECAPLWHAPLISHLRKGAVVLLVGQYAHKFYLGRQRKKNLTATVEAFREYLPDYFVLPHPSWRSRLWMQKNPWFEREVLPALRSEVAARIGSK